MIAGLYTFKVAVTGDGKYGETYVNVTVLPRKCSRIGIITRVHFRSVKQQYLITWVWPRDFVRSEVRLSMPAYYVLRHLPRDVPTDAHLSGYLQNR